MITATVAEEDVPAGFTGLLLDEDAGCVGVALGEESVDGALKRNVKLPVSGASVALSNEYETV